MEAQTSQGERTEKPSPGPERWWKEKEVPGRGGLRGWGATKGPAVHRSKEESLGKEGELKARIALSAGPLRNQKTTKICSPSPTPPLPRTSDPEDLPFTHKAPRKNSVSWLPLTNSPPPQYLPKGLSFPLDIPTPNPAS